MNFSELKPYQELIERDPDNLDYVQAIETYHKIWRLRYAICHGTKADIKEQMKGVKDVNIPLFDGELPPIFHAYFSKNLELTKFLVNEGFDVNAAVSGYGTLLDIAQLEQATDFIKYYKSQNALTKEQMKTCHHLVIDALKEKDVHKADALIQQTYQGRFSFILRHSLMDYAVRQNNPFVADYVFSKQAHMRYDLAKRRNHTWLHMAVYHLADQVIPVMVQNGFSVHELTDKRQTPLFGAVNNGAEKTIDTLLHLGADINAVDFIGRTPIHLAGYYGYKDTIIHLFERGAKVTQKDFYGQTPLDAARENHAQKVYDVLEQLMREEQAFNQGKFITRQIKRMPPSKDGGRDLP